MKEKIISVLKVAVQSILIAAGVCLCVIPFSCRISPEGVEIIGGDYKPPVLDDVTVIDSKTVQLSFSESVTIKNLVISPYVENVSDSDEHSKTESLSPSIAAAGGEYGSIDSKTVYDDEHKKISFILSEATAVGKTYEIYGEVEDAIGNSLTFCVPFIGFNSKVAKMIMTEVRSYTSTGKKAGLEFVEFLVVDDGNTAGLKVKFGTSAKTDYEFPVFDVKKGDIIVLHTENGLTKFEDETTENKAVCTHVDACEDALDLWADNAKGIIGNTDEVIVLYDEVNNSVMDALMFKKSSATAWSTAKKQLADSLNEAGIYDSGDISNATDTNGANAEKTISEKNTIHRLDSWKIYESVQQGIEIELPLRVDSFSWKVLGGKASPGKIVNLE